MSSGWSHSNSNVTNELGKFWDSLYSIHTFVYVLAFFELILKALLAYYLFADYRDKYIWKDLLKFNYSVTIGMDNDREKLDSKNELMQEQGGFEEEFKNVY